jgi:beta-mannanase
VHQYWPQIVPYINWNAYTGLDPDNPQYKGITTKDVAAGKLDDYIRQYARDAKVYGQPLFISPICKEFNGNWWYNCSPKANPALTEADFVNAWRRVVDIFRQEGVTNVAWVWVPNSITKAPPSWEADNAAAYYPGDDYVDWMGVDHYDYGPPSLMDALYDFAVEHDKPVFVSEWGVRSPAGLTPAQDQQWLNNMFDYFESHPKIKAIDYFNYNNADPTQETPAHMANHVWLYNGQVNYHPNIGNWDSRLLAESGADFRHTYARRIANPRYVSDLVK